MAIDGKTLGGVGGEGVLIERIDVSHSIDPTTKQDRLSLVLAGQAHCTLKNPYSKEDGFDDLPNPIPVSESIPVQLDDTASGKKLQITYDQLNQAFDLMDDPLVEREGEWERFLEGADRSVYDKIVGKGIHFKAKLKKDKIEGDTVDPSLFYFNMQALRKTMAAKKDDVMALVAKIKAKRAAAESSSGGVPF